MEAALVPLASPTTTVSALNVLPELSGAQPQVNASSFVAKMQFSPQLPTLVSALLAMVLWEDNANSALLATSSAMDIVSLALSTQSTTSILKTAIASQVSSPINTESVLLSVEPMKFMTLNLLAAFVFKVWEESMELVLSARLALRLLLMVQVALLVDPTNNS